MENAFSIAGLIIHYIDGTISEAEMVVLEDWKKKNEANQALFEELTSMRDIDQVYVKMQAARKHGKQRRLDIISRIRPEEGRYRKWGKMVIAACIAAFLVLPASIWIYFNHWEHAMLALNKDIDIIRPGGKKALLQLANGNVITLSGHEDTVIRTGISRTIRNREGILDFTGGAGDDRGTITLNTPKGGEYEAVLEDGTQVWLNAASSLELPARFASEERRVAVAGEVYFSVAHDARRPFIVTVNNDIDIQVLGTQFNVKAYSDELDEQRVTLVSGRVLVGRKGQRHLLLVAGRSVKVGRDGSLQVENADITAVTGWKNGLFVFDHARMGVAMRQIARWYDVKINYASGIIPDKTIFMGKMERQADISSVMRLMALTGTFKFRIQGREVTILPPG